MRSVGLARIYAIAAFSLGTVLVLMAALLAANTVPSDAPSALTQARLATNTPGTLGTSHIAPSLVMTNGWTNLFPILIAVSAVSDNEAWAVGDYGHLIHYTDGSWTSVDPPIMRGMALLDISMASSNAGWIAAADNLEHVDNPLQYEGKAYQYDGKAWNERSTGLGKGVFLQRVSALGLDDAWGVTYGLGCDQSSQAASGPFSQIMHWDGSYWKAMLPSDSPYLFYDIKMTSTMDGWAVGTTCAEGRGSILLHYDGSYWTPMQGPFNPKGPTLRRIAVTGPNDIWMVGDSGSDQEVYHYSGGVWTSWSWFTNAHPTSIYMMNDSEGWVADHDIWHWDGQNWTVEYSGTTFVGVAGMYGHTWAVGWDDKVMSRPWSGPWTQQRGGPTDQQLNHVSIVSADEAWAVGNKGTILHYGGGSWQTISTTISADLYGVYMLSPNDGYAVGGFHRSNGVIAHWDGISWQQVLTTATNLYSVYMLNSDEGWVVGDGGAIWHGAGHTWTKVSGPTNGPLYAVAMDSPHHGWAVGSYPFLVEYNGTGWISRSSSLPDNLSPPRDLALAPSGGEGWIVGAFLGNDMWSPDALLHLSGGVWATKTLQPTRNRFFGVALASGHTAWAVGGPEYGPGSILLRAYHYTEGQWQAVQLPVGYVSGSDADGDGYNLYGVAMLPGQIGWAVGSDGTIIQYTPPSPTPNPTATASPEVTVSPTSTNTNSPTHTPTPTTTNTTTSTLTPIKTATKIRTIRPTRTSTPSPVPATYTPRSATFTPTAGPTSSPTTTATPTPISTPTHVTVPTSVATSAPMATSTATSIPTSSPHQASPPHPFLQAPLLHFHLSYH